MQKRLDESSKGSPPRSPPLPFMLSAADASDMTRLKLSERSGQKFRRQVLAISFVIVVVLPTLLTGLYYAFWASNQFAAEAQVAVRSSSQTGSSSDLLGIFTGVSSSSAGDEYIVMEFVRSRQILDKLAPKLNYRAIFSNPDADWIARFDPTLGMEDTVRYWRRMVTVGYDTTSRILTLKVRAFAAGDSLKLATAILQQSEDLINELSARARADAVKSAEQEVALAEERLRKSRLALQSFRETRQELDPRKKAESRAQIIETLQGELTSARARLTALRQQLSENAPSVIYQVGIIKSLEQQIEEERERIASNERASISGGRGTIGGLISDYEALATDREFAEKAYLSALSSLERARFDSVRQQRYLATVVAPALPDDAQYPKRLLNTFIVLALSFTLWALGSLIGLAVRDHMT
jgi:capsular polysaccharide transport system permease protein